MLQRSPNFLFYFVISLLFLLACPWQAMGVIKCEDFCEEIRDSDLPFEFKCESNNTSWMEQLICMDHCDCNFNSDFSCTNGSFSCGEKNSTRVVDPPPKYGRVGQRNRNSGPSPIWLGFDLAIGIIFWFCFAFACVGCCSYCFLHKKYGRKYGFGLTYGYRQPYMGVGPPMGMGMGYGQPQVIQIQIQQPPPASSVG